MNQTCKVCGEPAAGFHFGAFTCEGCKSFFGRSYNNLPSISECKNNGECIINKKNRTACKSCRLRKCLTVGMSKSGSRYGRRSNWFKIHCLLQEQKNTFQTSLNLQPNSKPLQNTPQLHHQSLAMGLVGMNPFPPPLLHLPKTKEELMLLGLDEYKNSASPSVSSPESHNSDSSVEVSDSRRIPLIPGLIPSPYHLPTAGLLFPPGYPPLYPGLLQPVNHQDIFMRNHDPLGVEVFNKRVFLDAVLQSQRTTSPEEVETAVLTRSTIQEDPIDLSMKTASERSSSVHSDGSGSVTTNRRSKSDADEESDSESDRESKRIALMRPTPLDLRRKCD